jgi:amidophosphoribosyltransferase
MSELQHECAVAAVYHAAGRSVSSLTPNPGDANSVALLVPRMLLDMQNRGQLAAGMASYRSDRNALIKTHKEVGTVAEAFRLNHREEFEGIMRQVDGPVAIGHVRYATCGGNERDDAQPFERDHGRKAKWFAFAFNGQLANYEDLKDELLAQGDYHLKRDTDTEIIMHSLAYELQSEEQEPDWAGVFGRLADRFDGAYNIVLITAHGELVVARDPLGFRPLCIAEHGPLFAAASESVPLANLGFRNIRSLDPGTLVVANHKGVRIERFAPSPRQAHCFFEWIYFANVASTLDDRSVYLSRAALGKELARLEDVPLGADTIVVPVPDTAKAAADAMAFSLGVPSLEERPTARPRLGSNTHHCRRCSPASASCWSRTASFVRPRCAHSFMRFATKEGRARFISASLARRLSLRASMGSICRARPSCLPARSSICPTGRFPKKHKSEWPRNLGSIAFDTFPSRRSRAR